MPVLRLIAAGASLLALQGCDLPRPSPPIRGDADAAYAMMYGFCAGGGAHMGGPMMGAGERAAGASGWLADARREIGVTSDQETAWAAYAAAVDGDLGAMDAMHEAMMAAAGATSAPERLEARVEAMRSRLAALEAVLAAERQLYAGLSTEQRATADRALAGHCWRF